MAELHVRNLPADLHQRLREQASSQGRSMSSEAQRAAIAGLRDIRRRGHLGVDAQPSEQMVREDRDTAR